MNRRMIYTVYERVWHWLQAATILLLSLTGFELHSPRALHVLGFGRAARLHEVLALVLIANGFLSLFYHLSTGALRKFLPEPKDFFSLAGKQVSFYLRGIFRAEAHPLAHGEQRLNALQQVTYLVILNVLLPAQVVSGLVLWQAQRLRELLPGNWLPGVALVHVAAAWLFVAFVLMHVYLTTTGRTPLSHMRAMVVGYETEPAQAEPLSASSATRSTP